MSKQFIQPWYVFNGIYKKGSIVYYIIFLKCGVILENSTYGGANSVFQYQPFQYIYIHILFLNCLESEKSDFCRCSYVTKCPEERTASDHILLFLSLDMPAFFQDEVTYEEIKLKSEHRGL